MFDDVMDCFRKASGAGNEGHIRIVRERSEEVSWRQRVLQPLNRSEDFGAMVTLFVDGGVGYSATSDLSDGGIQDACNRARTMALNVEGMQLPLPMRAPEPIDGHYESKVERPLSTYSLKERIDFLGEIAGELHGDDKRVVDDVASLWSVEVDSVLAFLQGPKQTQRLELLAPELRVVVHDDGETQSRSTGLRGMSRQGGVGRLMDMDLLKLGKTLRDEAIGLLKAPMCPTGNMDLVLMPDQMMLQIHESIGHPIELDRILGDERNYAGTSFVNEQMFGSYVYGSELLNVAFDPTVEEEFASYGYDDEGTKAQRVMLIEKGILKRPLGGMTSSSRSSRKKRSSALACSRSSSWNRPPTDRMANINVEPGASSFKDIISSVEKGILMTTNNSWSIDDSRNKFQFGCEMGQLIEDGKLEGIVKKPNYRGVSATFWRNLKAVGDVTTREVLGTPWCGKAEPNQIIRVGHASPVCCFADVDVFGGD
ncbi:MAG: TldD/PmbA family protein [Deltaproteobacteria bacterium]|nr:TldD/PmbA family protein [Deltaproteobacteria bacterium]